jgi:protein-S-isoprenylcysteine O-methyltransferase Ste14
MLNALELKVPPVALVFLFGALMWLASAYSPFTIALPWHSTLAICIGIVGLAIAGAGVLSFRRAETTVNPLTPEATTTMVTSGIYRFTRHPMYLGFLFVLAGGDLPLQPSGLHISSSVRVVHESISNHT